MDVMRAMAVFVSVVDEGSLTAAAAKSDMSATMVGNYLHSLEGRLGTSLLKRTTRRQHLTEFGQVYYDRCVEILGLVADADALALQAHATPKGRLRITAPATFGAERLMPALADYVKLYPAVDLDVTLTDLMMDLVEEGFEAAIRIGPLQDSGLMALPLAPYRLILCASPAYLSERNSPLQPQDLSEHDCLTFNYSFGSDWRSARSEWRLIGADGDITVPVSGRIQSDSSQGLRRAALAGMGIVMLPEVLLSDDIEAGRLIRLLPDHEPPTRPLNLVYMRDRRMTPKLRSFIDFVQHRFHA